MGVSVTVTYESHKTAPFYLLPTIRVVGTATLPAIGTPEPRAITFRWH